MTPQDYYNDFCHIQQMTSPLPTKVRMLTEMFGSYKEAWRVVGITYNALEVFASHNFKKVSKMGINRSHKIDRHKTYKHLLTTQWDNWEDWWKYYQDHDETILATSSENLTGNMSTIHPIDLDLGLFRTSGFGWKHGKKEQSLIQSIYQGIIS